jgi:hypothetical protein
VLKFSFGFTKTLVLFGIAAAALFVVAAAATMPSSATVEARETSEKTPVCHTEQVALDEGYGVSRTVERRVCDDL